MHDCYSFKNYDVTKTFFVKVLMISDIGEATTFPRFIESQACKWFLRSVVDWSLQTFKMQDNKVPLLYGVIIST